MTPAVSGPRLRRLLSGVGVLVAAGGVAAAGTLTPEPLWTPVTGLPVQLAVGDAALVCAAPPRLVAPAGEDPQTDAAFDATAQTDSVVLAVATGADDGPALVLSGSDDVTGRRAGALTVAEGSGSEGAVARAVPDADRPAGLGAVHVATTAEGDLRGLVASGCAEPAEDAWLVGGSTVVGSSSRLELVNPGPTTVTVDLTLLTPGGPLTPQSGQGIALAAGASHEVLLEGLVADAAALAVQVSVSGGRVAASLVESRLDGLTPRGVEAVVPGAAAAEQQTVPGVLSLQDGPAPVLRIGVPGEESAVVRWQVLGPSGAVAPAGAAAVTVPAGTVVDVPVEGLQPGAYTLMVDADVPVVAAAASVSGADGQPSDLAWSPSGRPLSGRSVVALPPGALDRRLLVSGAGEVDVQALGSDGSVAGAVRVAAAAGSTRAVDVASLAPDGAVALLVTPTLGVTGVHAALQVGAPAPTGADLVAVVAVRPATQAPGAVTVRPARDGRWP